MKGFLWFWGAFALFFALPFPCILYAGESWPMALGDRSAPWLALTLLGLSLTLWLVLINVYLHVLLLGPLRALQRVRGILGHGEPRTATMEHAEQTGVHVRGFAQWRLRLAFDNLSGAPITDELILIDSKPELHRFQTGNTIQARLSRDPGAFPNLALEGAQPELNTASLRRRCIMGVLIIAAIAAGYTYAYRLQSQGLGWTFLSFGHPLLVCPTVLCSYLIGLRLLARLMQADPRSEALKYRGIHADAKVLDVRQTGTYLNEQPQVEFKLEYVDREGAVQQVTVRRYVALIDLPSIPRQRTSVLYDPQDRTHVRMVDA